MPTCVMADKNKKEATPPPLLFMPAGGGLTLNPPDQQNFLMPVVQSEPPIFDDDCEADSFVGQGPPMGAAAQGGSVNKGPQAGVPTYFQALAAGVSDPFAQVAHVPPPKPLPATFSQTVPAAVPTTSSPLPPVTEGFPLGSQGQVSMPMLSSLTAGSGSHQAWAPPSSDKAAPNIYRQKGPLRYAPPPAGTYATGASGLSSPLVPPPSDPAVQPASIKPLAPPPAGYAPAPFMTPTQATSGSQPPAAGFSSQGPSPAGPLAYAGDPSVQQGSMPIPGYVQYVSVRHHWCYRKTVEGQEIWYTFSHLDSAKLEEQFLKERTGAPPEVVITDGGRYDVEIGPRLRRAVYWEEEPVAIQRCSWFYKRERDNRYVPYDEQLAELLENEYRNAVTRNDWHKRIELPGNDTVVMHNPNVIVHFQASSQPDEWGNVQGDQMRPRVVKRGADDFGTTEEGESAEVDHLVFVLHGIGDTCDVRFRSIVECVDDFRSSANSLIKSHFGPYANSGHVHRVEFLPVHWHTAVHSEATGIDSRLKTITLPSTGKLRDFVNNTLLDILFYTSPAYCQIIIDTVGLEMNRLFQIFLSRNPTFNGEVSVAGHSLGSSILFDLLMHQHAPGENIDPGVIQGTVANSFDDSDTSSLTAGTETEGEEPAEDEDDRPLTFEGLLEKAGLSNKASIFQNEQIDMEALHMCTEQDLKDLGVPMGPRKKLLLLLQEARGEKERKSAKDLERKIRKEMEKKLKLEHKNTADSAQLRPHSNISVDFICGLAGTGQPFVRYPQLEFSPSCLFALGSPIGVFLSVRGVQQMGENFKLPTCPRVFNIFHPFDPVAYRLEPLINPSLSTTKPVLVPHYKGRKRLHLELKESITRMGTDLKQRIVDSLRSTWNSLNEFARAHRTDALAAESGTTEGVQGLENELDQQVDSVMAQMVQQQHDLDKSDTASVCSSIDDEIPMGILNEGRRIDYVLQEKPIESFNDYLFALTSHGCYWTSEDTALLILKEIYSPLGIRPIMPGPDRAAQKLLMPGPPPPKSVSPYQGTIPVPATPMSRVQYAASAPPQPPPPPLGPPSGPPSPSLAPVMTVAGLRSLQGRIGPPSASSAASSRGSTPPLGGGGVFPAPSQGGQPGPPPLSGFVRSPLLPQ